MTKRKRRLSPQTRAKISRGLKRYHRAQRAAARRRSLAAKRAAVTRKANRELRRIQQTKKVEPVIVEPESTAIQVWEVTATLKTRREEGSKRKQISDVTMRLEGKPGKVYTEAVIRAAAWYALKHGAASLEDFDLESVNWRNTRSGVEDVGKVDTYTYTGSDRDEVLENARGIFNTVGMGGLRVALVE
jgi:hypothetical protein